MLSKDVKIDTVEYDKELKSSDLVDNYGNLGLESIYRLVARERKQRGIDTTLPGDLDTLTEKKVNTEFSAEAIQKIVGLLYYTKETAVKESGYKLKRSSGNVVTSKTSNTHLVNYSGSDISGRYNSNDLNSHKDEIIPNPIFIDTNGTSYPMLFPGIYPLKIAPSSGQEISASFINRVIKVANDFIHGASCGDKCVAKCTSSCSTICLGTCEGTCRGDCTGSAVGELKIGSDTFWKVFWGKCGYATCSSNCYDTCNNTCSDGCINTCYGGCSGVSYSLGYATPDPVDDTHNVKILVAEDQLDKFAYIHVDYYNPADKSVEVFSKDFKVESGGTNISGLNGPANGYYYYYIPSLAEGIVVRAYGVIKSSYSITTGSHTVTMPVNRLVRTSVPVSSTSDYKVERSLGQDSSTGEYLYIVSSVKDVEFPDTIEYNYDYYRSNYSIKSPFTATVGSSDDVAIEFKALENKITIKTPKDKSTIHSYSYKLIEFAGASTAHPTDKTSYGGTVYGLYSPTGSTTDFEWASSYDTPYVQDAVYSVPVSYLKPTSDMVGKFNNIDYVKKLYTEIVNQGNASLPEILYNLTYNSSTKRYTCYYIYTKKVYDDDDLRSYSVAYRETTLKSLGNSAWVAKDKITEKAP